jgi:hypothetical protein
MTEREPTMDMVLDRIARNTSVDRWGAVLFRAHARLTGSGL